MQAKRYLIYCFVRLAYNCERIAYFSVGPAYAGGRAVSNTYIYITALRRSAFAANSYRALATPGRQAEGGARVSRRSSEVARPPFRFAGGLTRGFMQICETPLSQIARSTAAEIRAQAIPGSRTTSRTTGPEKFSTARSSPANFLRHPENSAEFFLSRPSTPVAPLACRAHIAIWSVFPRTHFRIGMLTATAQKKRIGGNSFRLTDQ